MTASERRATRQVLPAFRDKPLWMRSLLWVPTLARRKPLGFAGLAILSVIVAAAAFAPLIAPFGYDKTHFGARLLGPNGTYFLGTDSLGRDLLSRLLYGARISLGVSFGAVLIAQLMALTVAIVSGYYGGLFDAIAQRFIDIWIALPTLIILITLVGVLGGSPLTMMIVVGITLTPSTSRLVRSVVLGVKGEAYIEAARAVGASDLRIMLQYILPNVMHIVIYSATVQLGVVILLVASLGFLGFGVPPPHPDLGAMLSGDGLTYMRRNPWLAVWPGLTITLVVFSFNVFGDALRDVLDPRLRGT